MIVDIGGGQYRDLDTDEQFLEVIREKISFEFAEIIREIISETSADFEEIKDERSYLDRLTDEYIECLQNIRNLAHFAKDKTRSMKRIDRNCIIATFEEIEYEAENRL